jgi:hypothetical protein
MGSVCDWGFVVGEWLVNVILNLVYIEQYLKKKAYTG